MLKGLTGRQKRLCNARVSSKTCKKRYDKPLFLTCRPEKRTIRLTISTLIVLVLTLWPQAYASVVTFGVHGQRHPRIAPMSSSTLSPSAATKLIELLTPPMPLRAFTSRLWQVKRAIAVWACLVMCTSLVVLHIVS